MPVCLESLDTNSGLSYLDFLYSASLSIPGEIWVAYVGTATVPPRAVLLTPTSVVSICRVSKQSLTGY